MRTVNLRIFPLYFVCCGALLAGCSDTGGNAPNPDPGNPTAGVANGTSGSGSSAAGQTNGSGGSAAGTPAAAGTGNGTPTAGTATAGSSGATGGSNATTGGAGGTPAAGGSDTGGGPIMVGGFQRPEGQLPNSPRDAGNVDVPRDQWKKDIVSPSMDKLHHHNQPTVLNGYLNLNGNEEFWFWDITDPAKPTQMTEYLTPNRNPKGGGKGEGEAESHCTSYGRYGNKFYQITTGGKGVDIWDVTNQRKVVHVQQLALPGMDYGDYTAANWGLSWQGNYIYVGGTDQGVFVLDAHDPTKVTIAKQVPNSNFGGVNAGPVDAIGNVLVVTTPKENGGIATLDISDPVNPKPMASFKTVKSYIGQFYRHYVFLQSPLRAWDVLTDPFNIGTGDKPLASTDTPGSEYLSFGDNHLFLGRLRPDGGATVYDVTDPAKTGIKKQSTVWGRLDLGGVNDDQFSLMIGNLLVLGDDQEPYAGTVITQWAAAADKTPPVVDTVIPKDKSTGNAVTSRIGISLTDNIEFVTVNEASFIVRPVGGQPLKGTWGSRMGVINFSPNEPLQPATTYEVVLPKGGITDLVLNGIAEEFKSTFTTK